jgi:cellulose synthase/poly-beta-1,6-N-acetylglucosamine synthase-like glycosyltransferase
MITYGRVEFLEEALHSFLIQDYPGKKELVIVNDYPLQKLVFDHPDVTIYNLDETFKTIGEKENYAIERCSGELIAVWDDDDVALSNHLSNIAKFWRPDANILHWENGVFYNEPNITSIMGLGNSGIVYSKKAWEAIGKSPIQNAGGDMTLVVALQNLGRQGVVLASPPNKECSWFYMWGGRGYHQSGQGTDTEGKPNIIQRHSEYIEDLRKKNLIPTGDIQLNPHWNKDYAQMLKDYVNK